MSPTIVNSIKASYDRKTFFGAAKSELAELQYQLSITGFLLAQKYGKLDRPYLRKVKLVLESYDGSDTPENIIKFINAMLEASDAEFNTMAAHLRAEESVGLSLKKHSTILIDSNANQVSNLPVSLQSKIYEFKNSLNIYNQEIETAKDKLLLTYDSSLSDENHKRIKAGLTETYADLQNVCFRISHKIQAVLDFEL